MVSTNDEVVNDVSATEVQQALGTEIKAISEEEFEKAQKTFQMGKKNLFLNKYDESVNNIGEACKIYASKYGELDSQCAEVYFFYGKALLELARLENNVLGNALNGVPEDTEPIDDSRYGNPEDVNAEEKKEISEKVIEALCDNEEQKAPEAASEEKLEMAAKTDETPAATEIAKPAEETETKTEIETEKKTEEIKSDEAVEKKESEEKKEGEAEEDADAEEDGDEEADAEEMGEDITKNDEQAKDEAEAEDISNLQRSWEMFELAKLVYTKNFNEDLIFKNKRIAECLLKLGEISIEQEIYDQAINDINESIRIQEEQKEDRDERMLAESFYQLGLAQQFNNLFTEANDSYQKSINILQLKIEKLKGKLMTMGDDADSELAKNTIKEEIAELEALLPEMTGKLEEVTEQGQQSLNLIKEAKECFLNNMEAKANGSPSSTSAATSTNGEVKDITSLVKSKRKICGSPANENGSVKKTRLSDADDLKACEGEDKIEVDELNKEEKKSEEIMNGTSEEPKTEEKPIEQQNELKTETEAKPIETEEKIAVDEVKETAPLAEPEKIDAALEPATA